MKRFAKAGCAAALAALLPAPATAQTPTADAALEEIVVTARRTGVPVWRVTGPANSVILIGSIQGVAKETEWDPAALTETLKKADRVMFPGMMQLTGSPFALIGYYRKFRKQATLPEGQTLVHMMRPEQFERLVALRNEDC